MADLISRIRKLCLCLPEAHEVEAWGEPTFRVRNKLFAMYATEGNHHGSGRPGIWAKSTHVNQDLLVHSDAERFFSPPYVGPSGWIGVYLDGNPDWDVIADLLRDAWLLTAPKRVGAQLDSVPADKPATAKKKRPPARKSKTETAKRAAKRPTGGKKRPN